jgi:hypothetical protein
MRADPRELHDLVLIYPSLNQSYLGKQGEHDGRRWRGGHPLVAWELLVMGTQVQPDLTLDDVVDQQAEYRQHSKSRDPFGFLQPHWRDRRRRLDPAKARLYSGILVLIGLKNLYIRTDLRVDRRGQHGPPIVLCSMDQRLGLDHEAIARLGRGRLRLCWTSPTGTARAAGGCPNAIASRVRAPGPWAPATAARRSALLCCRGGFGVRQTGQPLRVDALGVGWDCLGFFALRARIRLGVLLRELTRMHDDKTERCSRDPSVTVLDLDLAHDTLAMPATGRLIRGAPRLL